MEAHCNVHLLKSAKNHSGHTNTLYNSSAGVYCRQHGTMVGMGFLYAVQDTKT